MKSIQISLTIPRDPDEKKCFFTFAQREAKKKGVTLQTYIILLIGEDKERKAK